MAQMYPNTLDQPVKSEAERKLYRLFRDDLDNDYIVFHQVNWQTLDGQGRPLDGEADFIIAHPQRGIMVLEVKGGTIRCNPRTGKWTSTARTGQIHQIKDPFKQTRDSRYVLLDQLKKMLNLSRRRINIVDAVSFPDVVFNTLPGLDKPRDIVMDQTDLLNLSAWVGKCLAYRRGSDSQHDTAPGNDAVEALLDLLGKTWELRPALWGDIRHEKEHLIRLTKQQFMILNMLNQHRRALISGCAGSGKTMVAVEKTHRLAKQKFRVLFTCFGKPLATDLRKKLSNLNNVHIDNFHALCFEAARHAGTLPSEPSKHDTQKQKEFYDKALPEALMDAIEYLDEIDALYDAVIVDEGQDFLADWWVPLQMLLRDSDEGIMYIFFDNNQRIYKRLDDFPIQNTPCSLTVNCRNTQNIHKQVAKFYKGPDSNLSVQGPLGRPVEVVEFEVSDGEQFYVELQNLLQRLIETEQIPHEEIVVLSPIRQNSQLWIKNLPDDTISLTNTQPLEPNQVYATTIHDFKGLESTVVILVEAERCPSSFDLDDLFYVACSRASNHLIILLPKNAPHKVRERLM